METEYESIITLLSDPRTYFENQGPENISSSLTVALYSGISSSLIFLLYYWQISNLSTVLIQNLSNTLTAVLVWTGIAIFGTGFMILLETSLTHIGVNFMGAGKGVKKTFSAVSYSYLVMPFLILSMIFATYIFNLNKIAGLLTMLIPIGLLIYSIKIRYHGLNVFHDIESRKKALGPVVFNYLVLAVIFASL